MEWSGKEKIVGILEWFHFGDKEHVERALTDLKSLGVTHLRTGVSWADWCRPGGEEWITWLIERLSLELNVLPCFVYTPPFLGVKWKTCSPPREILTYADFVQTMLSRFGHLFDVVELWNEPNNPVEWDNSLDPDWKIFSEMVRKAAEIVKGQGKATVLGGMSPCDVNWLSMIQSYGVLEFIDVVGVHGFPGTWEKNWKGWEKNILEISEVIKSKHPGIRIWITEVGFSTLGGREAEQLELFKETLNVPVERIYWYSLYDLPFEYKSTFQHITGRFESHEHHMGMKKKDGTAKLLFNSLLNASASSEARQVSEPSLRAE